MSKNYKKILSVVLAVLVLVAGFSTTLGAFKPVSANSVTVYDYTTIVPEFNAAEVFLANKGSGWNANHAIPTDALGLFDYNGISTNLDANQVGLRVYDDFFTVRNGTVVGSDDASKVYPYVTYEVEPGTSFSAVYNTYNIACWEGFNLADKAEEYHLAEIFVSSDGVNFIPAKVENSIVYDTFPNYDKVTATVANVGANTRYVKFQFACDADAQTYRFDEEKKEWVYNYVPQDALFLQRVTLTAPTVASTETKVSFTDSKVTVNGADSALGSVFLSQPVQNGYEAGGIRAKDYSSLNKSTSFNAWPTTDVDWLMRVQPGTRFFMSYNGHANTLRFAQSAVDLGLVEDIEDLAFKVYTAANPKDFENGTATEHRLAVSSIAGTRVNNFKYNFIIPENHTYLRIVHPLTGGLQYVPIYNASGAREDNVVGNDRFCMDHITYTPFDATSIEYDVTYNYLSGGDKTAPYVNKYVDAGSGLAAQGYSATPFAAKYPILGLTGLTGDYSNRNERTDDQLPYAIWKVVGDSFFKATVELPYAWKTTHHDNVKSDNAQEMHFEISTSVDGVDWTVQNTFGKKANPFDVIYPYNETAAPHNKAFDVETYVPAGANYVRVKTYSYGAKSTVTFDEDGVYVSESGVVCNNDVFVINEVSLSNTVKTSDEAQMGEVTYPYNDLTKYPYGTSYATTESLSANAVSYNDSKFSTLTSSVAASNITLDNYAGNKFGITMVYKDYGANSGTAARPYIIYKVNPGTQFIANLMVDYNTKVAAEKEDTNLEGGVVKAPFEFYFSTAASLDGEFTEQFRTTTGSNADQNVVINVPKTASYVKVEFPQTGNVGGGIKNHQARLLNVAYVPFGYEYGQQTYNYEDVIATTTEVNSSSDEAAFNKLVGSYAAKNNLTLQEKWPDDAFTGGLWAAARGGKPGTAARAYLVYNVEPGTTFRMNTGISVSNRNTYIQYGATDFEFIFSTSASADGGFVEFTRTNTTETSGSSFRTVEFTVPAGVNFIKVEFPQTGYISEADFGDLNGDGDTKDVSLWGNHSAMIYDVAFVPNGVKEPVKENDYVAKGEVVLDEEVKTAYEIYDFDGVIGTANGLAANADDAYVTYKVSNNSALVIKSADTLDIAVSYDGKTFVDAQLYAYGDTYTVNVLEGKQYVKVALDAGETITAVKAASLAPTATFVNYAGTKVEVELDAYGATPAEPAIKDRVGYTFDKWDTEIGALYLDKTYTAQYNKNETDTFAVTLVENENATISYPDGVTAETVRFDDRVTLTAAATNAEGKVFDKWVDADGNTIANSRNFSFLASDALTITAVYADAKTEDGAFIYNNKNATITDNGAKWSMSVVWRVNVPAGTTIKETGLVLAATNTTMELDADGTVKRAHSSAATGKTLMYTVNNIVDGATRYARPYAVLEDGTVIYGTTVTAAN